MKKKRKFLLKSIGGLFLIKILFFSTFYLSSCNKEQSNQSTFELTLEQKIACQNFVSTLKKESSKIKEFVSRHETEINELRKNEKQNIRTTSRTNISIEDSLNFILLPSTRNAQKVILAFGATEQDIIDSLGSLNDSRQITAAFALLRGPWDNLTFDSSMVKNTIFKEFFGASASAAPKWLECVGEALGLTFFQNISTLFAEGGERAAKKILGEVVKRYLGPAAVVGVVATYLWCMW
jgi:hypothetical protein